MNKVYNFSQEEIQDIINMYINGVSTTFIMQKYNMRNTAIYRLLRKNNIALHGKLDYTRLTEEDKKSVLCLYQQGVPQKDIADKFNVSTQIIRRVLKEDPNSGYTPSSGNKFLTICNFTKTDIENIVNSYRQGDSAEQIAKRYNVSDDTTIKHLREHGVAIRNRVYDMDEHYFDKIDNQDKAYLLGLLYADGCNNTRNNTIMLTLQEEDVHILYSVQELLKTKCSLQFINRSLKNKNWKNIYSLQVSSKHMSETLEKLGVVKAKSLILTFPEWLDKSLYPHFIRGYFDGDGHISKQEHKYNMSIVGTESFCKVVQKILANDVGITSRLHISTTVDKPTRTLMVTKRDDNKKFFDYIYKDANLYFYRKYNVYQDKYCENYWNKDNLIEVANRLRNKTE